MALQLKPDKLSCWICQGLLRDPVTVPCGHSFCLSCVSKRWDQEDSKEAYSCSLCSQTFTPRPALVRNVMFADLLEELKKTRLLEASGDLASPGDDPASPGDDPASPGDVSCDPASPGDDPASPGDDPASPGDVSCDPASPGDDPASPGDDPASPGDDPASPGDVSCDPASPGDDPASPGDDPASPGDDPASPGDVPCDSCSGRRLRAVKSCLVCRVSYCELHLQPHYESAAFQKHTLVDPCENLQEKFCSRHEEVMKIYCRTDQKTICIFCSLDEHKDHDTVSAAAERKERWREVGRRRQSIQLRIIDREKDVKALQREAEAINDSADKALTESEEVFSELVNLMEKMKREVKEEIRARQESEIAQVKELEEKLRVQISELKTQDTELEKLSHIKDHVQFLLRLPLLSHVPESTGLHGVHGVHARPLRYFDDVTAAVSKARHRLEDVLRQERTHIQQEVTEVDVFLPGPEPRTREDFLKYWRQVTLDPDTANTRLKLSDGNRRVTVMREQQVYPGHSDRFRDWLQVLGAESLRGRCYWEVERSSGVCVGAAYRDMSRTGSESGLGNNERSWALGCFDMTYYFRHNGVKTVLSGPRSSRVGVFLDHRAGTLSFYSVSETMRLLHKVQTTFSQPLYAGLWIYWVGDSAELCELPETC